MRLSPQQIKSLQSLLNEQLGLVYTDEEAQEAGYAIMRFVVAKQRRSSTLINKEGKDNVSNTHKGEKDRQDK